MRLLWALLVLLSTAAAAGAQIPKMSKSEAWVAFEVCVLFGIHELDDRRSDVRSIAAAVLVTCRDHDENLASVITGHAPSSRIAKGVIDGSRQSSLDFISLRILEARRKGP
jgi:hypothetical protein